MPIDIHQRLSEFSYGYGITREIQAYLNSVGLRTVPFLPSLLHEAKIGCDVHFDRPGAVLLIQFKLGQELKRRPRSSTWRHQVLNVPFWRFSVDTAAKDGQYDILLKAEHAGAEVYYVAPRFATWDLYVDVFQNNNVLDKSLLIKPSEIDGKLQSGEKAGNHKVVYDASRVYVCSKPTPVSEQRINDLVREIRAKLDREETIRASLQRIFDSFNKPRKLRSESAENVAADGKPLPSARARTQRLNALRQRANTNDDALFAAIGGETWAAGIQLFAVSIPG